ncbi:MAG: type II toxin-antitoxin system VapC family toxin [Candidatus Pacearchaeota archaeon]
MERQKKIIDTSIAVKWFLNEKNSDKALQLKESFLRGELILVAPDLILLEILNALKYNKKKESELIRANRDVFDLNMNMVEINNSLLIKAIENSIKYDITIYDALYVAVAQIHGVPLITADTGLYKIPNVIALEKI